MAGSIALRRSPVPEAIAGAVSGPHEHAHALHTHAMPALHPAPSPTPPTFRCAGLADGGFDGA